MDRTWGDREEGHMTVGSGYMGAVPENGLFFSEVLLAELI